mmetsp:Transcript_30642/g.73874  ORF Transcript_30642/g.73874 Transcript_30642/m.73874 type:complete len:267 (-) Transcript_30642:2139-2939(-)
MAGAFERHLPPPYQKRKQECNCLCTDVAHVEEAVAAVDRHEEVGKHNRDDGHELHHDVERGPRGVLEGIPDSVTHNHRRVDGRLLAGVDAGAAVGRLDALIPSKDADVPLGVLGSQLAEPVLDINLLLLAALGGAVLLDGVVAVVGLGGDPEVLEGDRRAVAELEHAVELTLLSVLLGIVPRAARVGHGDGELHRGGDAAGQEASNGLYPKEGADDDRGADDEDAGSNHLAEGGLCGNLDTRLVVRLDKHLPVGARLLPLVEVETR